MESLMFIFCVTAPLGVLMFSNYTHDKEMRQLRKELVKEFELIDNRISTVNGNVNSLMRKAFPASKSKKK
jgi:hypothetical protein